MSEQQEQYERVRERIARVILSFCRERIGRQTREFHADELRRRVQQAVVCAPGSPDRILRGLRQTGALAYHVLDRRASLYRLDWVDQAPGAQLELV